MIPFDYIDNQVYSTVAVAPSPAGSGTILEPQSADISLFPDPATVLDQYNLVVWPTGQKPTRANSTIIRVTDVTGNVITFVRTQESSNNRSILAGDQIALMLTKKTVSDIHSALYTGWLSFGLTFTYGSVDGSIFTMTVPGDLTSLVYAGWRVKLTQSTGGTKYFIVQKVEHATGTTTFTIHGGTDYTLNNEAISSVYFSPMKAPAGFPLSPLKWTVETTNASDIAQSSPVQNTWYNIGTISIDIPIGVWNVEYLVNIFSDNATGFDMAQSVTLSTANNTESDTELSGVMFSSAVTKMGGHISRKKTLNIASKTPYYLNARTIRSGQGSINFYGSTSGKTIIRAVNAYL